MPISLERFNRITTVAETYLNRDKTLRILIAQCNGLIKQGRITHENAFDQILSTVTETGIYHPDETVITEERVRFNLTYKRALMERDKARARRAANEGEIDRQKRAAKYNLYPEHPSARRRSPTTTKIASISDSNVEYEPGYAERVTNDPATEDNIALDGFLEEVEADEKAVAMASAPEKEAIEMMLKRETKKLTPELQTEYEKAMEEQRRRREAEDQGASAQEE